MAATPPTQTATTGLVTGEGRREESDTESDLDEDMEDIPKQERPQVQSPHTYTPGVWEPPEVRVAKRGNPIEDWRKRMWISTEEKRRFRLLKREMGIEKGEFFFWWNEGLGGCVCWRKTRRMKSRRQNARMG